MRAPAVGIGIGRFAYALLLPDMKADLALSYAQAGWLNTTNAIGYFGGVLVAASVIGRIGAAGSSPDRETASPSRGPREWPPHRQEHTRCSGAYSALGQAA